jgi:hypothetical protein
LLRKALPNFSFIKLASGRSKAVLPVALFVIPESVDFAENSNDPKSALNAF